MLRSLSLAVLFASLSSCKLVGHDSEVADVREFPEYGGWLPMTGRGTPALEYLPRSAAHAPSTREATEKLVAERGSGPRYRSFTGEDWLGLMCAPLVGYGMPVPASLYAPERERDPHSREIAVEVSVVEPTGAPIAGAQVATGFGAVPTFLGEDGARRLTPLSAVPWSASKDFVRSLAVHAPADFVGSTSVMFHPIPCPYERPPRFGVPCSTTDEHGLCHFTLKVPEAALDGDLPLAHLVAWRPGLEAGTATVVAREHQSSIWVQIRLGLPPAGSAEAELGQRLWDASQTILHCVRASTLHLDDRIDHDLLRDSNQRLRELMQDASAPNWIRTGAADALERQLVIEERLCALAGSYLTIPRDAFADEREELAEKELAELRSRLSPEPRFRLDSAHNPWRLAERFENWLEAACEVGLDRVEGDDPSRTKLQDILVSAAKDLLADCEALDPSQASVEILRAGIALGEGDFERALAQSRFLDTRAYFGLFYGRLRNEPGARQLSAAAEESCLAPSPQAR